MRGFDKITKSAVGATRVAEAFYLNNPEPVYYERRLAIETKLGIVLVYVCNWETNSHPLICSYFTTIYNGYRYGGFIDEQILSDRSLKWNATHFLKLIQKQNQ